MSRTGVVVGTKAGAGAALLSLFLFGCPDDGPLLELESELLLPESVDFGRVSLGVIRERTVSVRLAGTASRRIERLRIEPADGPVRLLKEPGLVTPGSILVPESSAPIRLAYRPLRAGPLEAELVIKTDGDAEPETIKLVGEGLENALVIRPDPVDFGLVRLGDRRRLSVQVVNGLSETVALRTDTDASGQPRFDGPFGVFRLENRLGPSGELSSMPLPPGEVLTLDFVFMPATVGDARAGLEVRFCDQPLCVQTVRLEGQGVESGLRCTPPLLDLGFVSPGSTKTKTLRCENPTHRGLRLSSALLLGADAGKFEADERPATLGPFDAVEVEIRAIPLEADRGRSLVGSVYFEGLPDVGSLERAEVQLRATVARAELEVVPSEVRFGRVALGVPAGRQLALVNPGDRPIRVTGVEVTGPYSVEPFASRLVRPGEAPAIRLSILAEEAGDHPGLLTVVVDDDEVASIEVPLTATALLLPPCRVRIEPSVLDFGVVPIRSSSRRSALVANESSHPCLLRPATVEGSEFSAVDLQGGDVLLQPDERFRVEADYHPRGAGEHAGTLRLSVSDPDRPERLVPLSGAARAASWLVSPNRLDFGAVRPGCVSLVRETRIYNFGVSPLTFDQLFSTNGAFTLVDPPGGGPIPPSPNLAIAGGNFVTVGVRYQPEDIGLEFPAELVVREAGSVAYSTVEFVGEGAAQLQTDRFKQGPVRAVDVLMVLDNSPSMETEQASMIANADRFLREMEAAEANYQIAVISTDMDAAASCANPSPSRPASYPQGACGYFSDGSAVASDPNWRIVDPTDLPSPVEAFSQVANLGIQGGAVEKGLAAAAQALSPTLLSGHNAGFLRPSANLAIIFISDEPDFSPDEAELYVGRFGALKGSAAGADISVSAVTQDEVCGFESGVRYQQVSRALGGITRSICSNDWGVLLADLARDALGIRDRFQLSAKPVEGSLEVRINGTLIPASTGGGPQWRYDETSRSVVFEPAGVPSNRAEVAIRYEPQCQQP